MFELLIGKDLDTLFVIQTIFFDRYENTIAGQFFGHAHSEELKVFYDEVDTKRPVSMVCISVYHPHL
jgi:hypothetical protein